MNHVIEQISLVASMPPAIAENHALLRVYGAGGEAIGSAIRMDSLDRRSLTVGRHLMCDIVLDDPYVAARHCQIEFDTSGHLHVTDLGTVNGIRLDGDRVARAMLEGSSVQTLSLGKTRLRLQLSDHALAPELPLGAAAPLPAASTKQSTTGDARLRKLFWLLFALFVAQLVAETWLTSYDQRVLGFEMAASVVAALAVVAAWTGVWALISRLVIGSPHWTTHACIAMAGFLLTSAADSLLSASAFAISLVLTSVVPTMTIAAIGGFAALYWHLSQATRLDRRGKAVCAAIVPLIVLGLTLTKLYGTENTARHADFSTTYLLPPGTRLRAPVDVSELLKDARTLKDQSPLPGASPEGS